MSCFRKTCCRLSKARPASSDCTRSVCARRQCAVRASAHARVRAQHARVRAQHTGQDRGGDSAVCPGATCSRARGSAHLGGLASVCSWVVRMSAHSRNSTQTRKKTNAWVSPHRRPRSTMRNAHFKSSGFCHLEREQAPRRFWWKAPPPPTAHAPDAHAATTAPAQAHDAP